MMTEQFKQRLLMSSLGILSLAISIYYSYSPLFKPFFILLNASIISLALSEYYQLARHKGFNPLASFGIGSSIAYILALSLSFHQAALASLPSVILLLAFLCLFLASFKGYLSSLGNLAITLFGIGYLTLTLSCALRINYFFPFHALEDGRLWLAYVLIVSKMTDIGAYFCGKIFGKHQLAPSISPKKTIEGSLGGTVAALLISFLFTLFVNSFTIFNMSLLQSIWIGILISILAQLGDLAESLLKRDAGVKDSSRLPGLGGFLDIMDSLVFTLPLIYLLLEMQIVG